MRVARLVFSALIFVLALTPMRLLAGSHEKHAHANPHQTASWLSSLTTIYHEFMRKVDQARRLDEDNEELRKKVGRLESDNAKLVIDVVECREGKRAERLKAMSRLEGGVESARTVASLEGADPKLLSRPPKVIFEEATQAFSKGDFETAAKGLVYLSENPENDVYHTPQAYYLAGVSLYRLGNYKKSLSSFDQARNHAHEATISYAPRALAWSILCHRKLGNQREARLAMNELMQKYPRSREALKINRGRHD